LRFNKVKENIEMIYKIYYEMITKYEDKNRNYEAFMSLNGIKNNNFVKNLENINLINNINDKSKHILNIYEQMFQHNQQNIIITNNIPQNLKLPKKNVPNKKLSSNSQNNSSNIIDDYNLNSQTELHDIKKGFLYPPLIGLENLGNSSYMNSTIQCFCNIDKFVNYFKYNNILIKFVKNDVTWGNKTLASSFKLLVEKLWPDAYNFISNNKKINFYTPKEFKNKLTLLNYASSNPKELIKFIISTLHKELNRGQKKLENNIKSQDKRNKELIFHLYAQDFADKNISIISDLFYAVKYNIIQCQYCFCKSYDFQTYFFLDFPLEEIILFKNQNMNQNNFNFNDSGLNIYDFFSYEQRIIYLTEQNQLHCDLCRQEAPHKKMSILVLGPEILIIMLNRENSNNSNIKINYYEDLNLYNFIEAKET